MFHVLQFDDGIAVVCDKWISKDTMECILPRSDISKHVKRNSDRDSSWETLKYQATLLTHDDLDYVYYRAHRFDQKGTMSETDLDQPRPKLSVSGFRSMLKKTAFDEPSAKKRKVVTKYSHNQPSASSTPKVVAPQEVAPVMDDLSVAEKLPPTIDELVPAAEGSIVGLGDSIASQETSVTADAPLPDKETVSVLKELGAENMESVAVLTKLLCANYVLAKENNAMLKHLCNVGQQSAVSKVRLPICLPCSAEKDLPVLNRFLELEDNRTALTGVIGYLDGSSVRRTTYCVAAKIMTASVASNINWLGKAQKISLKNDLGNIYCTIKMAVDKHHPNCYESEIVDAIQRWLKKSPQLLKL